MRRPAFALDGALCALAGLFYLVNHFLLSPALAGTAAGWFLSCYANDVFAGLAICAWAEAFTRAEALRCSRFTGAEPLLITRVRIITS